MFQEEDSSSFSDQLGNLMKHISDNQGNNYVHEQNSSSLNHEENQLPHSHDKSHKRKTYSKKISSLLKLQSPEQKTKIIKKNCVSAKMSRQRKKLYIELLEQKAESLKKQINYAKNRIKKQKSDIMNIVEFSNYQKSIYIKQKIKDSNKLANMIQLEQNNDRICLKEEEIKLKNQPTKQQHHQIQINICSPLNKNYEPQINSFLYKFGFNGVLKSDVLESQKQRWYEVAFASKILENQALHNQLENNFKDFEQCLSDLSMNNQKMQCLVRKIQNKIKDQFVMKFMIDKVFMAASCLK